MRGRKHRSTAGRAARVAVATAAIATGMAAQAATVDALAGLSLVPGTVNIFRDNRGPNNVGNGVGDRVQMGADIVGGSSTATIAASYPATGFARAPVACGALAVNANFCSTSVAYSAARTGAWTLDFARGGLSTSVTTPTLAGAETPVPFPVSVTMSGSGAAPTIRWEIPGGFRPDGVRINIRDRSRILDNGSADVIHSVALPADALSYTLPAALSSGQRLAIGGDYAINIQLVETRGHVAFTNNNAEILRRSSSFFNFSPRDAGGPPDVKLPTVTGDGVYHFNVAGVGPDSITFIDPVVAVGYDYAIGAGDPNFASVTLPDVGDGIFELLFTDALGSHDVTLAHDTQYFFGGSGVSAFSVRGIETSAGLDPDNVTAFVTGLTFASAGSFTGTMTPITVDIAAVPEPPVWALIALGIVGAGAASRPRFRR